MMVGILNDNAEASKVVKKGEVFEGGPQLKAALKAYEKFWKKTNPPLAS